LFTSGTRLCCYETPRSTVRSGTAARGTSLLRTLVTAPPKRWGSSVFGVPAQVRVGGEQPSGPIQRLPLVTCASTPRQSPVVKEQLTFPGGGWVRSG
jgi:hypothetical protein